MRNNKVNRRTVVAGAAVLAAASVAPRRTMGQGAARPASSLPARGEFVVRGANVLTMDAALGELAERRRACARRRDRRGRPPMCRRRAPK